MDELKLNENKISN